MPAKSKPNEKLARSQAALKALQRRGQHVFQSNEFTREDREMLLRSGFIRRAMKGWLFASSPSARDDDSSLWHSVFWEFCARYCQTRFAEDWHFSAEQSLLLMAENRGVPAKLVIYTTKGKNNVIELPFGTSIYDLKQSEVPPPVDIWVNDGLRVLSPAAALVRVSESLYLTHPIEVQSALEACDASDVVARLLEDGRSHFAGRLAGAFRRANRPQVADKILAAMKNAGYDVREKDPFAAEQTSPQQSSPIAPVGKVKALWNSMRTAFLRKSGD